MRIVPAVIAVAVLLVPLSLAEAKVARAAVSDLIDALDDCDSSAGAFRYTLDDDVADPSAEIVSGCDVVLDLAGHMLRAHSIVVATGTHLVIEDSAPVDGATGLRPGRLVLDASSSPGRAGIQIAASTLTLHADGSLITGGPRAAGIGTGPGGFLGEIVIKGNTTRAIGGQFGAGIGGGDLTAGGSIRIEGDDTIALGGAGDGALGGGAGIGGGAGGAGGTIRIVGDRSYALGGKDAAGIGGGSFYWDPSTFQEYRGEGGDIEIAGNNTRAVGTLNGAGIGGGWRAHSGTVRVSGDLTHASSVAADGILAFGAGIGGGYCGGAADVTVSGNDTRAESALGAGIGTGGGGYPGLGYDCTIGSGSVVVSGDRTIATSQLGAGIGGGTYSVVAYVLVSGDDVRAESVLGGGAGIGSGAGSAAVPPAAVGTIRIEGTGVVATSGARTPGGAGVGAGAFGDGGSVEIAPGASLTAYTAGTAAPAVGAAAFFGTVLVSGVLELPLGRVTVPDTNIAGPEIVVGSGGVIRGAASDPTVGAQFSGSGQIDNLGTITLAAPRVTGGTPAVTVTGNHSLVRFEGAGDAVVFASTMLSGQRAVPATFPTPPIGSLFSGWRHAGAAFTETTVLPDNSTGVPVTVEVTADLVPHVITLGSTPLHTTAGEELAFSPRLQLVGAGEVPVPASAWSAGSASPGVTVTIDPSTSALTVVATRSGQVVVDVVVTLPNGTVATSLEIAVAPGPLTALALRGIDWSGGEVQIGDTLTLHAEGADRFGNSIGDVTGDTRFVSDQPGDVVVGNTVRFTHASPHVITATHVPSGVTSSLTVEVASTAVPPGSTGPDPRSLSDSGAAGVDAAFLLGLCLLLAGAALTILRARRRQLRPRG